MKSPSLTLSLFRHGVAAMLLAAAALGHAQTPTLVLRPWVAAWGAAPAGPPGQGQTVRFHGQSVRMIVRTTLAGNLLRVRLSNEFGSTPLTIGAAHLAVRRTGSEIVPGSSRQLTFGNFESVTIAPGAPVLSDPVVLGVPALTELAVTLYLPGAVNADTLHLLAFQTNYVSPPGNFTAAQVLPVERTLASWPFLTEVDVQFPASALVAFGDSVTDGVGSTPDGYRRWPDVLAQRLRGGRLGVVNRGIGGNRLLRNQPGSLSGEAGLVRFDRDVLATAGVRHVLVQLGINDIGLPGVAAPACEAVSAQDLIAGYRQLIIRARARGLRIYGATITPFEGTLTPGYYTARKEAVRLAVNQWMRSSGEFDAVIDFDQVLRDPARPARMLPVYDSGDHLHPNDLGMQALAQAIPLELFTLH